MSIDLSALVKPAAPAPTTAKENTGQPTKLIGLRIPTDLAARLQHAAWQHRTTQTQLLTQALLEHLDKLDTLE